MSDSGDGEAGGSAGGGAGRGGGAAQVELPAASERARPPSPAHAGASPPPQGETHTQLPTGASPDREGGSPARGEGGEASAQPHATRAAPTAAADTVGVDAVGTDTSEAEKVGTAGVVTQCARLVAQVNSDLGAASEAVQALLGAADTSLHLATAWRTMLRHAHDRRALLLPPPAEGAGKGRGRGRGRGRGQAPRTQK